MKVALVVGSLRKNSYNLQLAKNIVDLAPEGVEFQFINIEMPLFSEDLENNPPKATTEAASQIKKADLVVIISPEYNRSIPGGLKNMLDWLSRPCADFALNGKPVAIGGVSTGGVATAVMQSQLRATLLQVGAHVLPQPTLMMQASRDLTDGGNLSPEAMKAAEEFINKAIDFANKLA